MILHSYGKIYNLGHRAVRDIFSGPVQIQEKVDGSQFNFGVRGGELHIQSKGATIHAGANNKQFSLAVETVTELFDLGLLVEGWTYRGEAITRPHHNHLRYERIPNGGIILFDIDIGEEDFIPHQTLTAVGSNLDLEVVPEYEVSIIKNIEDLNKLLDHKPFLGSESKIEGIVIKPVDPIFDQKTGKALKAKLVAPEFREKASASWKAANPNRDDVIEDLIKSLATEARWRKAIQYLEDSGEADGSPKDIGPLMGRIQKDIFEEEKEHISEVLFKYFWKKSISRGCCRGFPEFYKQFLLERQFEEEGDA